MGIRIPSPVRAPHPSRVVALAVSLAIVLGFVDWLTGPFFSFTVFYLFPVALAAWYAGRREAILLSLLCALIWTVADFESFRTQLPLALDLWNAAVRLLFFLLVSTTLAAARGALDRENELAREIQHSLLPASLPKVEGVDIASVYRPATVLSGDFFDVLPAPDGGLVLCIADVAGKGAGPALLMASLQAAMRALVTTNEAPAALCRELNDFVCRRGVPSRFITFFTCRIDATRSRLSYCNAGHNPPLLIRRDGSWCLLTTGGLVLGIDAERVYRQGETALSAGDVLVLYTDGVTEARDRRGREFGESGLVEVLMRHRGEDARAIQERLITEVERFNHGGLADDVTLLVIRLPAREDRSRGVDSPHAARAAAHAGR